MERTKTRCISHCDSLIRAVSSNALLMKTSTEREKIQQNVKEALSKRKRQFA